MPKKAKAKLYTGCGDNGHTCLPSGLTVSKNSHCVIVLGTLDELNAHIGFIHDLLLASEHLGSSQKKYAEWLHWVQERLFTISSLVALQDNTQGKKLRLTRHDIRKLETFIDLTVKRLKPLHHFIYPSGNLLISAMHMTRAVCRRAERESVELSKDITLVCHPIIIPFLNRLSDALFACIRAFHQELDVPEDLWVRPN